MRTDLDHLPPEKQRELEHVIEVLFDNFGDERLQDEIRRIRRAREQSMEPPCAIAVEGADRPRRRGEVVGKIGGKDVDGADANRFADDAVAVGKKLFSEG